MRERASPAILPGQPHRRALKQQRAKSQRLTIGVRNRPTPRERCPISQHFRQLRVQRKSLRHPAKRCANLFKRRRINAGAHRHERIVKPHARPALAHGVNRRIKRLVLGPLLCRIKLHIKLEPVLGQVIGREHALAGKLGRERRHHARHGLYKLVQRRLRKTRLILLVVPVLAEAHNINKHVAPELMAVPHRKLAGRHR